MSDYYNPMDPNNTDSDANEQVTNVPREQVEEKPAPQAPATPFVWNSDGTYHYSAPTPNEPPVTPSYTPPAQPSPNGWNAPQQEPHPPKRKGNGVVIAFAIIAAIGVLAACVCVAFAGTSFITGDNNVSAVDPDDDSADNDDAPSVNDNAPSLIISDETDDGGLTNREIINRNLNSTVVLTSYTMSTDFQFGESALVQSGAASGIVMSQDGYIITNWHCVTNEKTGKPFDRIDVMTYDRKVYEDAQVVGADESTDLAVIKIDAKGLTVAEFGDSSQLAVGDRVVTLGNAAGLEWSASQGIVSALARDVYDDAGYAIKCLQTDAAINPGNSGGPLLNNSGKVVAINSSKIVASGYEGLGFSIPINEAKTIIDSLLKYGYVKGRVALGITGQTISSGMYKGFLIMEISKRSCFANTDVRVGDLIVGVGGTEIADYAELRSELSKHKVGDRVEIALLRSDSRTGRVSSFSVTVKLQEQSTN